MHELDMKSSEFDSNRRSILEGPDYSFQFHVCILGANKRVRNEALDVFGQENTFIAIIGNPEEEYEEEYDEWPNALDDSGVSILAEGDCARAFPMIGMTIEYQDEEAPATELRKVFVITIQDLPAICARLQRKANEYPQHVKIRVSFGSHVMAVSKASKNGLPRTGTKLHQCLNALTHIRGVQDVEIDGMEASFNQHAIKASICGPQLGVTETLTLIAVYIDKGDKASASGAIDNAIDEYKSAIHIIRGRTLKKNERDNVIVGGRFHGLTASWAREDAEVRIHARIAALHLRAGKFRLARIYVERIYAPLVSFVRGNVRPFRRKFPLEITSKNWAPYAELLFVAAQISVAHGNLDEASRELYEAHDLDPENLEVKEYMEVFVRLKKPIYERSKRRHREHEKQIQLKAQKYTESLQIARNRAKKGDEAYRHSRYSTALDKYTLAFEKLTKLQDNGKGRWSEESTAIGYELLEKITSVSRELQDFENVHHWGNLTINFESQWEDTEAGRRMGG
ncbi:hypothetical protein G7Y79_00006g018830 [Physcia stellaris]|nr:hypothetical protein G7Y79_00006g018830 [Physcia stellaris]